MSCWNRAVAPGLWVVLALALGAPARAEPLEYGLKDARGQEHTQAELREHTAVVLVFLGLECPLSNRSIPELNRLAAEYGARGVRFLAVNADREASAEHVRQHDEEYRLAFPTLLDGGHVLVRHTGVRVTPEVAVLDKEGRVLYRGRMDDRAIDFGKVRPQPQREDLRLALEEVLAGKPVSVPTTPALGCSIPGVKR
jgi:thiol-disulfide isomerase/thioredoxin